MDELHLKAAVIVGHSMGSSIAQRFALEYPDKLLGLVLVGSSLASRGNPHLQAFWESRLAELTDPIDPAFIQEFLDTSLPQALPSAFIQAARRDAQSVPARVWKEAFRSRLEEDLSANLHTIETPTLLIWGDQDARSSQSDQEALIAMLPNSSLVVYLGAGHDPTIEEPARFAADLLSFINELGS
jgi:pimeloyl-ACP methyl ester carboxylesterase